MAKNAPAQSRSASRPAGKTASASKTAARPAAAAKAAPAKRAPVVQSALLSNLNAATDATRVVPRNKTKRTAAYKKRAVSKVVARKAQTQARPVKAAAKKVQARPAAKAAKKAAPAARPKRA
mgnify:CR=1 FL=1